MADKKKKEDRMSKFRKYFRDTASEFKKIVWPSRKQVWNNTVVVLVTMLIFAVIIWALDYGFNALREWMISSLNPEEISLPDAVILTLFKGV